MPDRTASYQFTGGEIAITATCYGPTDNPEVNVEQLLDMMLSLGVDDALKKARSLGRIPEMYVVEPDGETLSSTTVKLEILGYKLVILVEVSVNFTSDHEDFATSIGASAVNFVVPRMVETATEVIGAGVGNAIIKELEPTPESLMARLGSLASIFDAEPERDLGGFFPDDN